MSILYEEYSPWKAVHFLDRLKQAHACKKCAPVSLQLSLTDKCTNKCVYCYLKEHNLKQNQLQYKVVHKLLCDASNIGIKGIEITGGGDPLSHPDIWKIVEDIHDLKLDLGLITNGHGLKAEKLKNATWVRISLDSYNPNTYRKIRNAKFLDLAPIKELCSYQNVTVGACCVLNRYNYNEVYDFILNSKNIGFKNVWLKPVEGSEEKYLRPQINAIKEQLQEAKKLITPEFKIFMPDFSEKSKKTPKEFSRCYQQHVATFVGSDGGVYPCCSLQISEKYALGNINQDSLSNILNKRKELSVSRCPLNCFWTEKNKFMNYLVEENPKHVNFM